MKTIYSLLIMLFLGACGGSISPKANNDQISAILTGSNGQQSPSSPISLQAQVVDAARIDLTWTASAPNSGVVKYQIQRVGPTKMLFETTLNSYSDSSVIGETNYIYQILALDAANKIVNTSDPLSVRTSTGTDSAEPTAPTKLTAKAVSATQVNLDWIASTDNVGVTKYQIIRVGIEGVLAETTLTTYSDLTALGNTEYSYQVRAIDAANNMSSISIAAIVKTPKLSDTVAPTVPGNFVVQASSSTQINLSWTASVDNVGVAKYQIFRAGSTNAIAETTLTSYNDNTVLGGTSYSYQIRATDAANNMSALSDTVIALTPSVPDNTAPTAPTNLNAKAFNSTRVDLSWKASSDNVAISKYQIIRVGVAGILGETTLTTFSDMTVVGDTNYSYQVKALDATNNQSTLSNTAIIKTPPVPDTTSPSVPANLVAQASSPTQVRLTWAPSSDNVGVAKYQIFRVGVVGVLAETTLTNYSDITVLGNTNYLYNVRAIDAANNSSSVSITATVKTPPVPDTTAPTTPTNLSAQALNATIVNLNWTASSDNVAVAKYQIFRSGSTAVFAETINNSFNDTTVVGNTSYTYQIRAFDVNNNSSALSNSVTTQTPSVPDTTPPSIPTNLGAVAASATRINLTWTASTDSEGVATYQITRVGTSGVLAETTSTSYSDMTVVGGTSYSYQVRALDATNNSSALSNTATAQTPTVGDTTPPSTVANLSAIAASATRINLVWLASTDNVGVARYQITRVGTAGILAETSSNSYSDLTVLGNTSYSYQVRAVDAANNLSNLSNIATVQTPAPDASAPRNLIGMNVGGTSDWEGNMMFANATKTARGWFSADENWIAYPESNLDIHGWPTTDARLVVFAGLKRDNSGTYTITYESNADATLTLFPWEMSVTSKVRNATTNVTTATIVMTNPSWEHDLLSILFKDTGGGIRNVKVMYPITPGNTISHDSTEHFSRQFLKAIEPFSTLRFLDYMRTVRNPQVNWSDRTRPNYAAYNVQEKGGAWEDIIMLGNQTGKAVWINIPMHATDDYIRQLAMQFRDGSVDDQGKVYAGLNPNVALYVEYSNELWNWAFPFEAYRNQELAVEEVAAGDPYNYGYDNSDNIWDLGPRRVARRSLEISQIFRSVFGDARMMTQVRPVLPWAAGIPSTGRLGLQYLEKGFIPMVAPGRPMNSFFYGGAVAPYNYAEGNFDINSIWNSGTMNVNEYSEIMIKPNALLAKMYGIKLLAYEGGPSFDKSETDEAKNAVFAQAWIDPRITPSILEHHRAWSAWDGDLFNYFTLGNTGFQWSFFQTIDNLSTPKYGALLQLFAAPRDPITHGWPAGTLVSGANHDSQSAHDSYTNGNRVYFANNSWVGFLFNVAQAGNYSFTTVARGEGPGISTSFTLNGVNIGGNVPLANGVFQILPKQYVYLDKGLHAIRLNAIGGLVGLESIILTAENLTGFSRSFAPPPPIATAPSKVKLKVLPGRTPTNALRAKAQAYNPVSNMRYSSPTRYSKMPPPIRKTPNPSSRWTDFFKWR